MKFTTVALALLLLYISILSTVSTFSTVHTGNTADIVNTAGIVKTADTINKVSNTASFEKNVQGISSTLKPVFVQGLSVYTRLEQDEGKEHSHEDKVEEENKSAGETEEDLEFKRLHTATRRSLESKNAPFQKNEIYTQKMHEKNSHAFSKASENEKENENEKEKEKEKEEQSESADRRTLGDRHSISGTEEFDDDETGETHVRYFIRVEDDQGEHDEIVDATLPKEKPDEKDDDNDNDDDEEEDDMSELSEEEAEKVAHRKCQVRDEDDLTFAQEWNETVKASHHDAFLHALLHHRAEYWDDDQSEADGSGRRNLASSRALQSSKQVYVIPVIFHIVRSNNHKNRISHGHIPNNVIEAQLDQINKAFRGGESKNSPDSFIRFELKDVRRYDNTRWFEGCYSETVEGDMRKGTIGSVNEREHTLNVWSCKPVNNILGWVPQFPSDRPARNVWHGVTLHHRAFSNAPGYRPLSPRFNDGDTLTHEIGHYLGLHHVFHQVGSCSNPGDGIPDTPHQLVANSGSVCDGTRDTCRRDPGKDSTKNYLDYSDDSCLREFTPDQIAHMRTQIERHKPAIAKASRNRGDDEPEDKAEPSPTPPPTYNAAACNRIDNVNNFSRRRTRCRNNNNCNWDNPRCRVKNDQNEGEDDEDESAPPTPAPTYNAAACNRIDNENRLVVRRRRCRNNNNCKWNWPRCNVKSNQNKGDEGDGGEEEEEEEEESTPTPAPTYNAAACNRIDNENRLVVRRRRCRNNNNCKWNWPRCNVKSNQNKGDEGDGEEDEEEEEEESSPTPEPTPEPTQPPTYNAAACNRIDNVNNFSRRRTRCRNNNNCKWDNPRCFVKENDRPEEEDKDDDDDDSVDSSSESDYSYKTCHDMPGEGDNIVRSNLGHKVCGIINKEALGPHYKGGSDSFDCETTKVTHEESKELCESAGFRLCARDEINGDVLKKAVALANGSCDKLLNRHIWTDVQCGIAGSESIRARGGGRTCRHFPTDSFAPACCLDA